MSHLSLPNEDKLNAVEGWLSLEEGRRLAYLASMVPTHVAIVELGSWKGRSTAFLASGSRAGCGAPVYAVDHWVGSREHRHLFTDPTYTTFPEFQRNMEHLGLMNLVHPITGETIEVAKTWSMDVGLLFIDAAHRYEDVKADFLSWSPFLVRGGWVVLHDADAPGPAQVVREFILASDRWAGLNAHRPFSAQLVG